MDVMAHQAAAALAHALSAAIPTMGRQDVSVIGSTPDEDSSMESVVVILAPNEANALTALVQLAHGNPGGICVVCGCPLANLNCGHTCCCSGGRR